MSGRPPSSPGKVFFLSYLVIVSISVFLMRFHAFGEMEPRSDQAFFSWWVQGLYQADHLFPDVGAGEAWLEALQRDEDGFLHRLLRPIYGKAIAVFTFVPLILRFAMTCVLGPAYGSQVAMSILASTAVVLMMGLYPIWARGRTSDGNAEVDDWCLGAVAVLLGATTLYLHFFSAWGNHNFGVLFLLVSAAFGNRILLVVADERGARPIRLGYIAAALAYGLACYAHWTNLFLLPAATIFSIIALPELPFRKRVSSVIGFVAVSAVLAIPFIVVAGFEASRDLAPNLHSVSGLAGAAFDIDTGAFFVSVAGRAADWLEKGSTLLSAPGLALGILGLAAWAQRERVTVPFFVVVTHFAVWCLMPIFGGAYLRTFLYATPFLVMGIAYLSMTAWRTIRRALIKKRFGVQAVAGGAVLCALIVHVYGQVPGLLSTQDVRNRAPDAWELYFSGQGSLKPAMAEIDSVLPEHAVIMTWGYGMQFLLRNYGVERPDRKIMPTLLTLLPRYENGTLADLIKRRDLSIPAGAPIYSLIDHGTDNVDRETVRQEIEKILGADGFGVATRVALEPKGKWRLSSSWPRDVELYRVQLD